MKKLRIKSVIFFFCFFLLLLTLNVFNISMLSHRELSTAASAQRKSTEQAGTCRGYIYDKNMIPLVNTPFNTAGNEFVSNPRYSNNSLCRHIVGYLYADGNGAYGLEKLYDNHLKNDTTVNITRITDPFGNPIDSTPISKENINYIPNQNLKITIDYKIQKIAEEAADEYLERGAIVILETDSFDIAAAVSRPNFNQNDIQSALTGEASPLMNKSLCSYNAGSIFKTITAAAILENGMHNDIVYECNGIFSAEGKEFACNKHDGHGKLDFKTAYAKSCNCFFYKKGTEATGSAIIQTAKKFGLGRSLLNCNISESNGFLPERTIYSARECANMSIGQGEILITPLQAANIMAIVANSGMSKKINLADSIIDERGAVIKNLRKKGDEKVISKENAAILADMMREAVLEGTAQRVQNGIVAVAGKTGTAQTGWMENGETMTHGWFCGFFPYDNPRYAMAVFAENGKSGSEACIPLFRRIVLEINKLYKMET
ncbi:MAG: penicillin-binding protein 2 [Clostridia bacterium]|nr:penicillin-binding protein 2 [Clostridia bacterium]